MENRMPNLNKVMLMGNLTRDPEKKHTPKGTAVCAFALAINRNYTTDSGEKREEVTFVECEAFARLAEIISEYCKKGHPLMVEGRLKLEQWDDKETGKKRSRMKVIAEQAQLLRSNREVNPSTAEQADAAAAARQRPATAPKPPADPDLDPAPGDGIPF